MYLSSIWVLYYRSLEITIHIAISERCENNHVLYIHENNTLNSLDTAIQLILECNKLLNALYNQKRLET